MNTGKFYPVMLLACATLGVSIVCIVIAFTTPYWLVSDGRAPVERFQRLGLWEACFKGFVDIYYRYDREFRGCKWIFDEDYNFIQDFLSPPFFVAVQVLFTLGLVCLILSCLVLMVFTMCLVSDKDVVVLRLLSGLVLTAGVFSLVAVITFGAFGDERNWMPDPDHNYLSWSFGLAVIGALLELGSGSLFLVEGQLAKRRVQDRNQQVFTLNNFKC
ncbi:LOW QUALITY PROTEIN: uncharacterized protein LOC129219978 [Uloborus diversus]|uniref:LOW QUALITY PROTEIN: uncharacterized protein LOC129219978 n=1 Tax=Uloborus diversus TaxID=327109 RepID=UPI002409F64C|nr:LOW QUALITY PROTEIN: uncharacterized protein LOC129219978 [Uloborus diversus]